MARMRLQWLFCCTIACLVWLALHASVLRAQTPADAGLPEDWHFQYDLFQLLLERQGLTPVAELKQALAKPRDSVIVIAGDPARLPRSSLGEFAQFVESGGALLLATDYRRSVPGIARFAGPRVTSNDETTSYQGFDDCVIVTAIASGDPRLAGVSTIITNRPSWLQLESNRRFTWDIGATFPESCLPAASRGQPLLAIGHSRRDAAGTIVLSADASPFTNGMLWHGGNAILAIRVSTILAGDGRTQLAFWTDGGMLGSLQDRMESRAQAELPDIQVEQPLPEPDLEKVLKLANAIASEVAQSNVLNETLQRRPRHQRPSHYFRLLLVMSTVGLFLAVAWLLTTSGPLRPFFAGARKAARRSARGGQARGAAELTDYRTPAGYLAREFCWELTGSRHSADWQKYLAQQLVFEPKLGSSDQMELAKIVDIASRGCRERMSADDFEQLGKTIAILRAKHVAP